MTPVLVAVALALLQFAPFSSTGDPRIQSVAYDADQIVRLAVAAGYATLVELSPDERVETVVIGNSAVWQVTAPRQGDRLVVKPLHGAVTTNMTVVTDVRRYVFLLEPAIGLQGTPLVLRFTYLPARPIAATSTVAPAVAEVVPATYRLSGARELWPRAMSDDGRRISISWDADVPMPAIFAVDRRGREQLVNGRMVGDRYVVEGIAPRIVFRLGRARATATRRRAAPR